MKLAFENIDRVFAEVTGDDKFQVTWSIFSRLPFPWQKRVSPHNREILWSKNRTYSGFEVYYQSSLSLTASFERIET